MDKKTIKMDDIISMPDNYSEEDKSYKEERKHYNDESGEEARKEKRHHYKHHHDYDGSCHDEFIFDYDDCDFEEESDYDYYTECCHFCENDDECENEFQCEDECEEDDYDDICVSSKKKNSCDYDRKEYEKGYECGFIDGYEKAKNEVQEYIRNRKNRCRRNCRCR